MKKRQGREEKESRMEEKRKRIPWRVVVRTPQLGLQRAQVQFLVREKDPTSRQKRRGKQGRKQGRKERERAGAMQVRLQRTRPGPLQLRIL